MVLVNGLTLKINKTNIINLCSKHYQDETFLINYQNNPVKESINIKFLELKLDKHITGRTILIKFCLNCVVHALLLDLCTFPVTCPLSK